MSKAFAKMKETATQKGERREEGVEETAVDRQMNTRIQRIQGAKQTGKKTKMNTTNSGPETNKN